MAQKSSKKQSTSALRDHGALLLRCTVAFIYLFHGIPKAIDWATASSKFAAIGFPGFLGPIVGLLEVILPVMIILGIGHKSANYILAVIIAVAAFGVHLPKGITAGFERDILLLAANLFLAWYGPGRWKVSFK